MVKTFVDQLVEYPSKLLYTIGTTQEVIELLLNDPTIEADSEQAQSVFDKYLFDYEYVDDTTTETAAYIAVESEVPNASTQTMQGFKIYVTVAVHKEFMKIDRSKFKGITGNRRDNLVRFIDKVLNDSEIVGIGKLKLDSIRTVAAPNQFSKRELTYSVYDFHNRGVIR